MSTTQPSERPLQPKGSSQQVGSLQKARLYTQYAQGEIDARALQEGVAKATPEVRVPRWVKVLSGIGSILALVLFSHSGRS